MLTEKAFPDTLDRKTLLHALTAFGKGDFTVRLPEEWDGIDGKIAGAFNEVVELNHRMAAELAQLSIKVGKEGKLGERLSVGDVTGAWSDSVASVNALITDLVHPVAETSRVIGAVAKGDLSQSMALESDGRPLRGEFLGTARTVNRMVGQLSSFASEVTRVAREVGTDGKLGGQAQVPGVAGTWKDLTDSVNLMAGNLTSQVRNIAAVTTAVASGDLSKKITVDVRGEILELKNTINTMVDQLNSFASEVTRVAREVGTEGKLGGQADVKDVAGIWKDLTDNVNFMAGNLTSQVRNIAAVTTAVASGDLSKKITVDVRGEILELKNTINTMVDQLNSFASEVTRVAREVGTEGKLGGQAQVEGVSGTWKDLTENVNSMARNLTSQVRGIARVVTAVADGDLKRKLTVDAKGEIAELSDTINGMTDTLATFADQVTTVAREVGVEGKLGGQASVPGAAGTWKDLTDNVNRLAANLTTQVRAIANVATAVTEGDLTRSIEVEAQGEVAALKDNINQMIRNLKDTTLKNSEQDWLKTNLAKFSRMLQGQKDRNTVGRHILSELAPVVGVQQALFYTMESVREEAPGAPPRLTLLASYAFGGARDSYDLGEGLVGQCAVERSRILLSSVPDDYVRIGSGLGNAPPKSIIVLPVLFEGQVKGVIELATLDRFSPTHEVFLDQLMETVGIVLNTIEANTRTEDLLKQSQSLARELQSRQEELQKTNQELEEKAKLLADRNVEVERKNQEIEHARKALEEKAEQLALTSKYKSEFLANMSHELRSPLNSLLILSNQLARNHDGNLTPKQTEYARTIHAAGNDLLALINDILDLSKIESGTVSIDIEEVRLQDLKDYVERNFRHIAEAKRLDFEFRIEHGSPRSLHTDAKRLQQVLKNLLSNSFKFTERGRVEVRVFAANSGWDPANADLAGSDSVLGFEVRDTGIGIPEDKQKIVFEAFQQAEGSTSRKYGGTGLGLAISLELAQLLGGDITLTSRPGEGSSFTLFLPRIHGTGKGARRIPSARVTTTEPAAPPAAHPAAGPQAAAPESPAPPAALTVPDDRDSLRPGDRVVLVVENDHGFARYLVDTAREKGFKAVVTAEGSEVPSLAGRIRPVAVILDLRLPDVNGWRILDQLKSGLETRHVPVYVVSTEDECEEAPARGAMAALAKPVKEPQIDDLFDGINAFLDRATRTCLLVHGDRRTRQALRDLLSFDGVEVQEAETGARALEVLGTGGIDAAVVGLDLPDMTGPKAVAALRADVRTATLPVVVYGARELDARERRALQRHGRTAFLRHAKGHEAVLDEVTLALHQPASRLPDRQKAMVEKIHSPERTLGGQTVLVVDDDVRNIFAMTGLLERQGMKVVSAENGKDAIEALERTPAIDVALMDIMMPEMDGYDTMRAIRKQRRFRSLPIIALTAKAMKGDREKCIEAGASDYIAKPVDTDRLLSLLCTWLGRRGNPV
jgi:signal transduction histidine kinase/DNA-binding response OmpR family regulator/HAMP domain-containing protein